MYSLCFNRERKSWFKRRKEGKASWKRWPLRSPVKAGWEFDKQAGAGWGALCQEAGRTAREGERAAPGQLWGDVSGMRPGRPSGARLWGASSARAEGVWLHPPGGGE